MTPTHTNERHLRSEKGFTLIELLVVILIIGILAAIAIPAFLTQRSKGQDAAAKSDVRNLVSHMEACFTEDSRYVGCTATLNNNNTGLDMGPNPGQVRIVSESLTGYEIEAISRARSNGNNHAFRLTHSLGSADVKECDEDGNGGCPDTGLW